MQQTRVLTINSTQPEKQYIDYAAGLLQDGELVVFPTETVYGLGANAFNIEAVKQIFVAKGRPLSDPLIVHIASVDALEQLVTHIPREAQQLAQAFWPGPLTLVLPASTRVPKIITAGLPNVAVRTPRHPIALALIQAAGFPIAAPSANRFMHVSPTTAQHARDDLNGRVPLILDGGPCTVGVESTVLDLSGEIPTILRPGGVSLEQLRTVLPNVQRATPRQFTHEEAAQEALQAPGQMLIHYAPSVPAYLFEGEEQAMQRTMLTEIRRYQGQQKTVGVLIADEDLPTFLYSGARIYTLGPLAEPEQIAANLFAGLRTLEEAGVQVILCRSFDEQGLGMAIRDRLLKATGGKVISV